MASTTAGPSRKRPRDESAFRQISPIPRRSYQTRTATQNSTSNRPAATRHNSNKSDSKESDSDEPDTDEDDDSDDSDANPSVDEEDSDDDDEPQTTQDKKQKARSTQETDRPKPPKKQRKAKPVALPIHDSQQLERLTADATRINVHNYHVISVSWTDRYIDQLLAHRKEIVNTRPPANVYAEAEIHQARYRRTKKLLSLIGHCSTTAMDTAL